MVDSVELLLFWFDLVCTVLFLYSAWINLVRKRISNNGVDAFIFKLFSSWYTKGEDEKTQLRENPQFIGRMGLLTVILGFSFLNATVEKLKIIWPYFYR